MQAKKRLCIRAESAQFQERSFYVILTINFTEGQSWMLPDLSVQRKTTNGRAELDAAGFIRAEENDKRTHIKKS